MEIKFLLISPLIWIVAMAEHALLSRGLTLRAWLRQAFATAAASIAAILPMAIAGYAPAVRPLSFAAGTCFLFQLAYPLLYVLDRRARADAYDHGADAVVGIGLFGMLSALLLMGGRVDWIVGPIELVVMAVVIVQVAYFLLYGSSMDAYGFRLMTQTNTNEIIEFIRYYPIWVVALLAAALFAVFGASVKVNMADMPTPPPAVSIALAGATVLCILTIFLNRSIYRCGIVSFYLDKRANTQRLRAYPGRRQQRRQGLDVKLEGRPYGGPSTIVLVIGESANRHYISAFDPYEFDRDTAPWLNARRREDPRHWMVFPNAYSCGMHTFVALEQGLTEKNQFNDCDFTTAASIVDMARAAGRRIYWFSNQGHLGASLSQVSVVANEADDALWTNQVPGMPPYDAELLPMLDRVDPTQDNLVVIHLKGNHFSFENRYPASAMRWQPDGPDDTRTTYMNSIHYVDDLLRRIWEHCAKRLNLKAMVYCSDHAIIPEQHRAPTFSGFGDVSIPLAVWTSDDFIAAHPERYEALQANRLRCWTNDFLYELLCGIMDVSSPRFNTANSLAHNAYAHDRHNLTILTHRIPLTADER